MASTDDERTIDEKGRVTIPKEACEALGLQPGADVHIEVEGGRIVIRPRVSREEFIEVMEGCITEETAKSDAPDIDPMDPLGLDDPLGHIESHIGIGGRDASLVAAMERREVSDLWTHDTGLKHLGERLNWLTVTDPAEQSPDE